MTSSSKKTGPTRAEWLEKHENVRAARAWVHVVTGEPFALEELLQKDPAEAVKAVTGPSGAPVTALTAAAERGDSLSTQMLLQEGADPNLQSGRIVPLSPLAGATAAQSVCCLNLLFEASAKPDENEDLARLATETGKPIEHSSTDVLEVLIQNGVTATAEALGSAVDKAWTEAVKMLLHAGADANGSHTAARIPVMASVLSLCSSNGPGILRCMLKYKADPDKLCGAAGTTGPPALAAAVERGSPWAIPILVKSGANRQAAVEHIRKNGIRRLINPQYDEIPKPASNEQDHVTALTALLLD